MSSKAFDETFTRHALASYAKQLTLADTIDGAGAWDLNLQNGTLSFAGGPTFQVGLLGSYGAQAGSWLWAWANTSTELPPEVLAAAERMRDIGQGREIPELLEAETPAAEPFCHQLAMVAVGETGAGCYYRAPYDGGAAYLVIRDGLQRTPEHHLLGRVQRVVAESISTFEIPAQRAAIEAYFKAEGFPVEETEEGEITASVEDGDLRVRFGPEGRITEMKSLLRAATQPSGGFFNRLFRKD